MTWQHHKETFDSRDLVKVEEPRGLLAVLKSGGPIMEIIDIDSDGIALCQWESFDSDTNKSTSETRAFPLPCLYRVSKFNPGEPTN